MTLTLRAVSLNEQPLTQPITAHFDAHGGSIGRYDDNTLALPDPERHISRRQAEIRAVGDAYTIRNVGSANPIMVRGQSLARGETTTLAHRDQVRIGGYLLEVIDDEGGEEASTITRGRATVEASVPPSQPRTTPPPRGTATPAAGGGPFADLAVPLSGKDPFADLLGPGTAPTPAPPRRPDTPTAPPRAAARAPAPAPAAASEHDPFADLMPPAAGVASSSPAWSPATPPEPMAKLPDDFDPFAAPPAPPAAPPPSPGGGQFDDLIPPDGGKSIDSEFGLERGGGDPLADFMARPLPGAAAAAARRGAGADTHEGVSTDPIEAMFGGPAPPHAAEPAAPAARDDTPALRGAYVPPAVDAHIPSRFDWAADERAPALHEPMPAPPLPPPGDVPAPRPAAGAGPGDTAPLWAAFCEGAGVRVELPQGLSPEMMKIVGSLLRNAVDGTLRLMEVRRATKHELRAQVTVIQSRNNNPLKFSPDAQVALEQLLKPPVRGFLPGPAAMTDAMHDLVGHSIGTMAGTRAALEGVLDRFAPAELESKLAGKSVLDSVLPMNRKARLWDLYLQKFEAIRNEAKDDFDTLFGKAFVAAYEQQLDRLEREQASASRAPDA